MPRPYSADLRERVLLACEAGEAVKDVARRFRVGPATVCLWRQQAREDGRRTPKPRARCSEPVGGNAAALAQLVAAQNGAERRHAPRICSRAGRAQLEREIPAALDTITAHDAQGWFRLCGYAPN